MFRLKLFLSALAECLFHRFFFLAKPMIFTKFYSLGLQVRTWLQEVLKMLCIPDLFKCVNLLTARRTESTTGADRFT